MARLTVSDEFLWQNYLGPLVTGQSDPNNDVNDSGNESSDNESEADGEDFAWSRLPDLLLVKVTVCCMTNHCVFFMHRKLYFSYLVVCCAARKG